MIEKLTHQHLTWYDVVNPSAEEIRELVTLASIPLVFTDDLTSPTPHTEAVCVKGAVKITLDFPIVKGQTSNTPMRSNSLPPKIPLSLFDLKTFNQSTSSKKTLR